MAKIEQSRQAEQDLIDIWCYIAASNPTAADAMLDQIESVCKMLARLPLLGHSRDELARGIRSFPVGNYLIFYRPTNAGIVIARVLSGYRNLGELVR
ncbi:MAG: type II toxin-antitoxin system RelE/ParE family toxin [Terriglobia bacterium]